MERRTQYTRRKTNGEICVAQTEEDKELGYQSIIPHQLVDHGNKEGKKGVMIGPLKGESQPRSK